MSMIEHYFAPTTVAEAAKLLHDGATTILAGGTDLTPQTASGRLQFAPSLMNIQRIGDLRGVSTGDGRVRIGALTTVNTVLEDRWLRERVPVLTAAADHFASSQLRNAATIGGNLCNASPAGDMIIPLLLLDADVLLASWSDGDVSVRTVGLADFFTGPGATVRRADELLTAVEFAEPAVGFTAGFLKSGPRPALEISTVSMGIAGVWDGDMLTGVRCAMGAVAPTPLRAGQTEALLEGRKLDEGLITRAAETAAGEISPIDDLRASGWYRTHLIRIFARRLLTDVADERD
jgi:CO/xanthine dehydrogenase FAD-binding subunit